MCGRHVSPDIAEAERYFLVHLLRWKFERSYNVAPTQQIPVVRMADVQREGVTLRWGLVPFFARGVPPKYSTINATVEKLTDGACRRGPWKRGQRAGGGHHPGSERLIRRSASLPYWWSLAACSPPCAAASVDSGVAGSTSTLMFAGALVTSKATRRFMARFSAVSLLATGLALP
jgi:hypothetical protein